MIRLLSTRICAATTSTGLKSNISSAQRGLIFNNFKFRTLATKSPPPFSYTPLFQHDPNSSQYEPTEYKRLDLSDEILSQIQPVFIGGGQEEYLSIPDEALRHLSQTAFADVAHLLRPKHLSQLRLILDDPEASNNDRFVALELLKNANIASARVLPGCQDTGTAIIVGKKGHRILTHGRDEEYLSAGAYDAYTTLNLRYSQVAPLQMFIEKNTGCNLPAQVDIYSTNHGNEYHFLFIAKGGGSANKTFLYQQTKALLNPNSLQTFLEEKIKTIGTSACPPYHLAVVVGGLSAEMTLKTVKMASCKYYDDLPTVGDITGRAFRDLEWEQRILDVTRNLGIGAQFGGKYFCHDVRVIRLPRHGASCPVGIGVSCSADRQVKGKITKDGVFLERLEEDVGKYLPEVTDSSLTDQVVNINMNRMTMKELRNTLSQYPVKTRLSLTGTLVVARDIAHAKLMQKIESGQGLPQYAKDYIIYYAGPAKAPEGYASGSFGPTTAGRMDAYVDKFMVRFQSRIVMFI